MRLVELCCGTASVSLWSLGRFAPLCGYMGSKRRFAGLLCASLGLYEPDELVLVDAGPWGDVWRTLASGPDARAQVVALLEAWATRDPAELWREEIVTPPLGSAARRAAQYLWLQGRAAGSIPVWWDVNRNQWRSPTGATNDTSDMEALRRTKGLAPSIAGKRGWGSGRRTAGLIAERIRRLEAFPWERVTVHHGDLSWYSPRPGDVVYIDPPYKGCPRYAALLPRSELLGKAEYWAFRGARVAISEAEPLPLNGWVSRQIPNDKPEWVTASFPWELPAPPEPRQLGLFAGVAP